MKKLSAILVGMSLVAGAVMAAGPVTSVNIVGYNKIECPRGKYVLVTTAFNSLTGTPLKSEDVFGSQLPEGSTIFAYDASAVPPAYIGDTLTFLGWDANITYKGGMGFWIYVDPSAPSNSYSVALSGEVPMQSMATNVMYSGYNMAGYSFTASTLWTNTSLAKEIEARGEGTIFTYDPVAGYTGNGYTFLGWDNPDLVIGPGTGFWVHNPSTVYTNLEVRPYSP
jgi:hypothetical protein